MIKVKVGKDIVSITGHANYDDYGKDIVCASVSATVMTSVEGIASFDETLIDIKEQEDKLEIIINKHVDITDKLISNMVNCLKEIEKQYPQNIKIINKEE